MELISSIFNWGVMDVTYVNMKKNTASLRIIREQNKKIPIKTVELNNDFIAAVVVASVVDDGCRSMY